MRWSEFKLMKREVKIYICILAFTALALGMSNQVLSNYFKDAYNVTAFQRGIIEFPREIPGFIGVFVIAALAGLSDIRLSIFAQFMSIVGIVVLAFFTPKFSIMLIFLFINSMGMHLFMPMSDSIGMSLVDEDKLGKRMGQYKGVSTAFSMVSAIIVFICFRFDIFSFMTPTKLPFLFSALFSVCAFALLFVLEKAVHHRKIHHEKTKFIYRKEYKWFYTLVVLFGAQKQIMMVYGPWVLIELLGKKADTLALLAIAGAFVGIFFIPALGRWLDRFGVKKLLYADGISFVMIYTLFGLLTAGYVSGVLPTTGWAVLLGYLMVVLDKMSTQMSFIRTVYLKKIAVETSDITPTLSLGMSMDHAVSITCAILGGVVWGTWGPQYIFFLAAAISLVNVYVAYSVEIE